jgi:hypothetical protein
MTLVQLSSYRKHLANQAIKQSNQAKDDGIGRAKIWPYHLPEIAATDAFGPGQIVEFYASHEPEAQAMQARRAFEIVQQFLSYL